LLKRKHTIIVALLSLLVLTGGCNWKEKHQISKAKTRVKAILRGITENTANGNVDEQVAVCRWWKDVGIMISLDELSHASNEFDRWRLEGGIFRIQEFEILEARVVKDAKPVTVIVAVTIDGLPFSMKVPEGKTIRWGEWDEPFPDRD